MNKKLFTLLPLLALGLVACGEKPAPTPTKPEHGSLEQPLTVAEILAKEEVQELESNGETEEEYFVTGVTLAVDYNSSYDNYTITLGTGEEDGPEFKLYRLKADSSLVLEGDDEQGHWTYKANSALKGATFVARGKVTLYGTTYEMTGNDPKIVKVENATKVYPSTDTHGKVETDPLTFTEAWTIVSALSTGASTDDTYFIRAKIAKLKTAPSKSYDNCEFYINASGVEDENMLLIYRVYMSGHAKTDEFIAWYGENVVVGADVLIKAKLKNYSGTLETDASGDAWLLDAQGNKYGYVAAK